MARSRNRKVTVKVVHKAEIRRSILLSVYQDISTSLSLITPVGDNEMMGKSVI